MPTHKSSKQGRSRRSRLAASRAGGGEPEIRRRQAVWGSTRKARSELGRAARPERAPACEKALREKASEVKVVRAFYHVQRHETQWQLRCEAISGRTVRPMVRLEDIEDLHAFRRVMAKAGFSFANDPARARRVHEDVMRQARRAAKDRGREVRLT